MNAVRYPVGGGRNGLVRKVGVAFGRLDQGVTEQLGDRHHVHAVHGGGGRPRVPEVVKPQAGQTRLVADAVPLVFDALNMGRRRMHRKQERAIGAVVRNRVDHGPRGARQPDRARPGFRVGKVDALAPDPVPFQRYDLTEAAAGQHQQPDDGDHVRAPELVAGQQGVEPGHFLGGQEPLQRFHPVAPGVLAGVGVVAAVAPKLGHVHHHRQHRHGAVGDAGSVAHGREPVPDLLDRDGVHGQTAESGEDFIAHDALVGVPGLGFPEAGLPVEEFPGECDHRMPRRPGAVPGLRRFDVAGDQLAGLGDRHRISVAERGVAASPAHHAFKGEGARAAREDAQHQPLHRVIADFEALVAGSGGADAPGEGGFRLVGHVAAP